MTDDYTPTNTYSRLVDMLHGVAMGDPQPYVPEGATTLEVMALAVDRFIDADRAEVAEKARADERERIAAVIDAGLLAHQPPATGGEADAVACAWSDYRADYGVASEHLAAAHQAFKAGWAAHRDGDTRGAIR